VGYVGIAVTVMLTVYGQLVVRWQVGRAGALPDALGDRASYLAHLIVNPWIISAFLAAFGAAVSWMVVLNRFELSRAYPFTSLSFVLVLIASAVLFSESITLAKVAGIALIVAGLLVGTR
jgi:multidrug transporter EmrE-like cation transporter